mgnify:CR=1 FL=1
MTDCARATVEERYLVAGNTSDLSVSQERRTAADLLIAAGAVLWLEMDGGELPWQLHVTDPAAEVPR